MAKYNLTSVEELNNEIWGPIGTPERDEMEAQLKEHMDAYYLGEAIKKARQAQNLTQEQLGERIGVQKAQISKLEKGKSTITLPTISRVFRALGVTTAALDLGAMGKIALW
ncbi:MAG: helix-turn-helix domain-containing protein [Lachnospiraceae bacterium]|nr:helix-turn-helix domain-containing protein [Lachnospiraceae bacterium]